VLDPAGKFHRPRKTATLRIWSAPSPVPEIAFSFIIGLVLTDKHAYVADCANRRILKVKLGYAASETIAAP
jgi:hypothetical protein